MPTINKPIGTKPVTQTGTDATQSSQSKAEFRNRKVEETSANRQEGIKTRSSHDALPELPSKETSKTRKFFNRVFHPQAKAKKENSYATIDEAKASVAEYRAKNNPDYASVKQPISPYATAGSAQGQGEGDYMNMSGVHGDKTDSDGYMDMSGVHGDKTDSDGYMDMSGVHGDKTDSDGYMDMSGAKASSDTGEYADMNQADPTYQNVKTRAEDSHYTDMSGAKASSDTGEYADMNQADPTYQNVKTRAEDSHYTDMSGAKASSDTGEYADMNQADPTYQNVKTRAEDSHYTDMSGAHADQTDSGGYTEMKPAQSQVYEEIKDPGHTYETVDKEPVYNQVKERISPYATLDSAQNRTEDDYTDMSGAKAASDTGEYVDMSGAKAASDTGEYVDMSGAKTSSDTGEYVDVNQPDPTYQNVKTRAEDSHYTDMSGAKASSDTGEYAEIGPGSKAAEPLYDEIDDKSNPSSGEEHIYEDPDAVSTTSNPAPDSVKKKS